MGNFLYQNHPVYQIFFVETIPLHIDIYICLRKVLRYQKNCVYLAEVQQDVFYEPSVQSKYC